VVPFILLQITALFIVGSYPALVNYLPNRTSYLSDNAPPPKNPRLQYCLESYSAEVSFSNDNYVQGAVKELKELDLEKLPKKVKTIIEGAADDATNALMGLQKALVQEKTIEAATVEYKPILNKVRRIESQINRKLKDIKELSKEQVLQKTLKNEDFVEKIERDIGLIQIEIDKLKEEIPSNWASTYETFNILMKEEQKLRNMYRRSGDSSYQAIQDLSLILASSETITKLKNDYVALLASLNTLEKSEKLETLRAFSKIVSRVNGTSTFKRMLSKAIKELKKKNVKDEKVKNNLDSALNEISELDAWVIEAKTFETALVSYLEKTKHSIGLRSQDGFSRDLALYLARCNANHRDLSLSF